MLASLANLAWLAASIPAWARFRRALADPERAQRAVLRGLLARHGGCAYGRRHAFDAVASYEEFARRVPLAGYEDLAPWIDRTRRGEGNVLTADAVTHLVPTSGSSGARKLIPFTAGLQREFNAAIAPWIVDLWRQQPALALGSAYWSVTPVATGQTASAETDASTVPIGFDDDSAYVGGIRRHLVNAAMAAPSALRHVGDMEAFRHALLLCLLRRRDLRLISVWHPSFLTLLLDHAAQHWERLLADLHGGGCSCKETIPAAVRTMLLQTADPKRADELARLGPAAPERWWPGLRVISCWGDGQAGPSMEGLRVRFPNTFIQPKGLLATETVITLPWGPHRPVAVTSHFYEFMDDRGAIQPAWELRPGNTYEVVVTTGGGLWRYRLGDRVEVTGYVERTPSLRFIERSGNVSDLCGEKLSEGFVAQTLQTLFASLPQPPAFAMLAPEPADGVWRYALYLEGTVTNDFAARLDHALRANPHYAYARDLGQLRPVRLHRIANRGYEQFVTAEAARGRRLGDIKPCLLSKCTDWTSHFAPADRVGSLR